MLTQSNVYYIENYYATRALVPRVVSCVSTFLRTISPRSFFFPSFYPNYNKRNDSFWGWYVYLWGSIVRVTILTHNVNGIPDFDDKRLADIQTRFISKTQQLLKAVSPLTRTEIQDSQQSVVRLVLLGLQAVCFLSDIITQLCKHNNKSENHSVCRPFHILYIYTYI